MINKIKHVPLCILLLFMCFAAVAQNNITNEVLPYRNADGYIIIRANVGGTEGDFLLDSRATTVAVTEESALKRKMLVELQKGIYSRPGYELVGRAMAYGFYIGNTVYKKDIATNIIKNNPILSKLKVDGIIGFDVFTDAVLTLNTNIKTITLSQPYRPAYIKISNRGDAELRLAGIFIDIMVNEIPVKVLVDFYEDKAIALSVEDFERIHPEGKSVKIKMAGQLFDQVEADKSKDQYTVLGRSLLSKGVLSFDVQRNKYYFQPYNQGEDASAPLVKKEKITVISGQVNPIDKDYFLEHVYDYKASKQWKTKGNKPVVIDFWATWCGPCMRMMPIMEQLAAQYKDKVIFYKVNVDKEGELRDVFNANAIPLLLFGSLNEGVTRGVGVDTKESVETQIKRLLK